MISACGTSQRPWGLYWVVPVPTGALKWDNGGKLVTIEMHDVPVIDQPKWPAHGARATLARMSFKMIFAATDKAVNYDDNAQVVEKTSSVCPSTAMILMMHYCTDALIGAFRRRVRAA